jgi:competence protein ComEC
MYTNNKWQLYPLLRLAITLCIGIVAGKLLYNYITIGIWLIIGIVSIISACIIKHENIQSILIATTTLALDVQTTKSNRHISSK